MSRSSKLACLFGLTAMLAGSAANSKMRQGVHVQFLYEPVLADVSGTKVMRYELGITNFAKDPLFLRQVEVRDQTGHLLAALSGGALDSAVRPVRRKPEAGGSLEPGHLAIVYVDLSLASHANPAQINHRLTLSDGKSTWTVELPKATVVQAPRSNLGPPLGGGPWVAAYEPAMDGGHRRAIYAVAGRATIPGRFAIDWFKVDEQGNHLSGKGSPVIAVADGIVAAASDDFEDPDPQRPPPLGPELENDAGNYVALKIAPGCYAFYEHLQHGLRVRAGERVHKGELLGYLGSTGHVTGPHLHFHVADATSPLGSNGIAFGFERLELIGRYRSIAEFDRGGPWKEFRETSKGLPPPNAVVRFPALSAPESRVHMPSKE